MTPGNNSPLSEHEWMKQAELADTKISVRAANCLRNGGYLTIDEVRRASDSELLRINNLGRITLQEIRQVIGPHDLVLNRQVAVQQPSCQNCAHVSGVSEPNHEGFCRRYPPAIRVDLKSAFPPVKLNWKCGEWRKS